MHYKACNVDYKACNVDYKACNAMIHYKLVMRGL